jgi:hypothetical protein
MAIIVKNGPAGELFIHCDCGCGESTVYLGGSVSVGGVITGSTTTPGIMHDDHPKRRRRVIDNGETARALVVTSRFGGSSPGRTERKIIARIATSTDADSAADIDDAEMRDMATSVAEALVGGSPTCDLTWKYGASLPVSRLADEVAKQVGAAVTVNVPHDAFIDDDD